DKRAINTNITILVTLVILILEAVSIEMSWLSTGFTKISLRDLVRAISRD
ncbi:10019_t:CDS:1, partial [Racocetra persica]